MNAITRLSGSSRNGNDFASSLELYQKQLLLLLSFRTLQRRLTASMQNLQSARLLVGRDVDLGLGPLAGRNLALEQNVDLAVRAALHLGQVQVCQGEAEETGTGPNVTALATKVGLLFQVSGCNQDKR